MKTLIILALMIGLVPPKYQKEGEELARVRYQVIAAAISAEAKGDIRLARFLITVAKHESSFRLDIHSGKKRGAAGEAGLFQVMVGKDGKILRHKYTAKQVIGVSPEATARAVEVAAVYLRPIIVGCYGAPLCVFKRYGGIPRDRLTQGELRRRLLARVATYQQLVRSK